MRMELHKARKLAEQIVDALRPMATRIEISGSIRRQRDVVGDIDLVIEPRPGQLQAIKKRCLLSSLQVLTDGEQNFLLMINGNVQLDIFFARPAEDDLFNPKPSNFGSLLICRTGSREHNMWLISQAVRHGAAWLPYQGVHKGGRIVAGDTEREVFEAIGVDYVKPEDREI